MKLLVSSALPPPPPFFWGGGGGGGEGGAWGAGTKLSQAVKVKFSIESNKESGMDLSQPKLNWQCDHAFLSHSLHYF